MEKEAQGNPAQPAGWAQGNPVNPDAHPGGELMEIEQEKRQDTAQWEDAQNRSPMDNVNPAQPPGFAVPEPTMAPIPGQGADAILAKVFVEKTASTVKGAKVLLASQSGSTVGQVVSVTGDKFWVNWDDGEDTIEKKADYELIIRDDDDTEE